MIRMLAFAILTVAGAATLSAAEPPLDYKIEHVIAHKGFDGKLCWVHARAGVVPAQGEGNSFGEPLAVMTTQQLLLSGSDVFYALNSLRSTDKGQTWSEPVEHSTFTRRKLGENIEETVCDFAPQWHAATGKLLGIGQTVRYENNRVMDVRPKWTAYAVYDPARNAWSEWEKLQLPDEPRFKNAGSGSQQRVDLPNGEILLPIYFKVPEKTAYSTTVLRCSFDGKSLKYLGHGTELTIPVKRGLYEPSIAVHGDRYFLTMRNDDHGYVSRSDDGQTFLPQQKWTFDDGSDLGNYNTQQHWVSHSDGLFLVYTRRGANNDHVFRHRAPLFIAQVDPEKLHVIRATERILVPERGARLGNFGVTTVGPDETWVTVAEWMQPAGVEKYGSDNSIWVAKLKWNRPNGLAK